MKAYLLLILLICTSLQAQIVFEGEIPMDRFGSSVSSAGDVNGDGYFDIIIGATNLNNSGDEKAYIYYGSALMYNIGVSFFGEASVSSVGDVNGDGYSDVIAGPNLYFGGSLMDTVADVIFPNNATSAGDVNGDGYSDIIDGSGNIYFGGISMNNIADVIFTHSGNPASLGDVNGDGYSDVIVGTKIYFGGSQMDTIADVIITESGMSLSSAGDVNGDGYSDIILGVINGAYIYFGGSSMNNVPDVAMYNDYMGNSVSSAGDINGDGYADVIIGASGFEQGRGRVYIYYGGALMNNIADITLTGPDFPCQFGTSFGRSVSSFSDGSGVIIGAPGGDCPGPGNAFLYRFYSTEPVLINPVNNSTINPLTINFAWSKFNSADYYILEISTNSLFSNIIVTDTIYADTSKIISGFQKETKYFWRVRAKDTSGVMINSLVSNFTTIPFITTNIKLLFEGMYSRIFNQLSRKDSITVYLRDAVSPFAIRDSAKNNIDTISFSNIFKFKNALAGSYYIVVKHLNSIETWSKTGGENLIYDTTHYNYDFTTAKSKAYGNNLKLKGSKYCIYSGDVNGDAIVDGGDLSEADNDSFSGLSGRFLRSDVNGDNIVDAEDVSLVDNNSYNSIVMIRP